MRVKRAPERESVPRKWRETAKRRRRQKEAKQNRQLSVRPLPLSPPPSASFSQLENSPWARR